MMAGRAKRQVNYAPRQRKRQPSVSQYDHITPEDFKRLRAAGMTFGQIAEHYDIPRGTVGWLVRKYGIPVAAKQKVYPATKEQLKQMREAGMSVDRIGEALGVSRSTVSKMIADYGLPRGARVPPRREPVPEEPVSDDLPELEAVTVPDEIAYYIRGHYGKVPRHEIARRLGVDKVTLNLMIIKIGLGS